MKGSPAACEALGDPHMTDEMCKHPLEAYRQAAKMLGTSCD